MTAFKGKENDKVWAGAAIGLSLIHIYGKFDGLVYGAVDASFLTEIVSGLHIGESGQAYILDEYGDVIGHPDPSYVVDGVNIIDQAKSDRSVADIAACLLYTSRCV